MASQETIQKSLTVLSSVFLDRKKITPFDVEIWTQGLSDISDQIVISTTEDFMSTGGEHPPSLPLFRRRAVELQSGMVAPISAPEAWERCLRYAQGHSVDLSELEQRALESIGGTYQIKTSNNIGIDRASFCKHYDAIYQAEFKRAASKQSIRDLERDRRELPGKVANEWKPDIHTETYPPFPRVAHPNRTTMEIWREDKERDANEMGFSRKSWDHGKRSIYAEQVSALVNGFISVQSKSRRGTKG